MINQIIWNVNPVIFNLGFFEIRYYSLFFALGFLVSYLIIKKIYKKENIPVKELDSLTVYVVVGGLLGARLGHCLFYEWDYFSKHILEMLLPISFEPDFHFTGYQGLASHGGTVGVIIAVLIFKVKSTKKSFFWLIDRIAIPTGFAGALIRTGNLFNSEIYGQQTNIAWGFVFERNGDTVATYPTQIYEALCYIITSILLLQLYKKEKFRNAKGFLLGVFFVMIFTARFFIEFFKQNQVEFENSMLLNMGQILSIPIVCAGLFLIVYSLKNHAKNNNVHFYSIL